VTADRASEWRKGRDGYGRKHRLIVLPTPEYDEAAARVVAAIREAAHHYRHGRSGALYCGGEK